MLFRWYQFTIMSKGITREQNRAFAVTGRRLATGDIYIFFNATTCLYELLWSPLLAVAEV